MKVNSQKRMAAEILKCGMDKVWIDPDEIEEVSKSITKAAQDYLAGRCHYGFHLTL